MWLVQGRGGKFERKLGDGIRGVWWRVDGFVWRWLPSIGTGDFGFKGVKREVVL